MADAGSAHSPTKAKTGIGSFAVSLLLLAVSLLLLYCLSYALLVERGDKLSGTGWNRLHREAKYRYVDSSLTRAFFSPIQRVDREVRRSYWYATYF